MYILTFDTTCSLKDQTQWCLLPLSTKHETVNSTHPLYKNLIIENQGLNVLFRLVKGRGRDKDDRTTISLSSKGSRGSRMSLAEGLGSQGSVLASTPRRLVQSTFALGKTHCF